MALDPRTPTPNGARRVYGPPPGTAPGLIVAAGVLLAAGVLGDAGARLAGAAAALVLLAAAIWVRAGAPVHADPEGITLRGLVRSRRVAWPDVVAIRVQDARRSRALEIETSDRLLVVPAYLLGRTPLRRAAAELSELRGSVPPR